MSLDMTDTNMLLCKLVSQTNRKDAVKMFSGIVSRKLTPHCELSYGPAILTLPVAATAVPLLFKGFDFDLHVIATLVLSFSLAFIVLVLLIIKRDSKINALSNLLCAIDSLSSKHPSDFQEAVDDVEGLCDYVVEVFDNDDAKSVRTISHEFISYVSQATKEAEPKAEGYANAKQTT